MPVLPRGGELYGSEKRVLRLEIGGFGSAGEMEEWMGPIAYCFPASLLHWSTSLLLC